VDQDAITSVVDVATRLKTLATWTVASHAIVRVGGFNHTRALRAAGGPKPFGQLGDGTTIDSASPRAVVGLP